LIDSAEILNHTNQVGDGGFGHITAEAPKARDRDIRNRPAPPNDEKLVLKAEQNTMTQSFATL